MDATDTCTERKELAVLNILKRQPFMYQWISQLKYDEKDKRIKTAAIVYIPARHEAWLKLCPAFVERLPTLKKVEALVQHELLHWLHDHPLHGVRDNDWQDACDLAVNTILIAQGYDLPTGADFGEQWVPVTPESIAVRLTFLLKMNVAPPPALMDAFWYLDWIKQQRAQAPKPQPPQEDEDDEDEKVPDQGESQGQDDESEKDEDDDDNRDEDADDGDPADRQPGGDDARPEDLESEGADAAGSASGVHPGDPDGGDEDGSEDDNDERPEALRHDHWEEVTPEEETLIRQMVAQQVDEAQRQAAPPGHLAGAVQDLIKHLEPPQVPWTQHLRRFEGHCAGIKQMPKHSRRNKYGMPPRVCSVPSIHLVVLADRSGSVMIDETKAFFSEMEAMVKRKIKIDLIEFDTVAHPPVPFKKADGYETLGGGGTDFNVPFQYIIDHKLYRVYNGVILTTDGECWWPARELIVLPTLYLLTRDPWEAPPDYIRDRIIRIDVKNAPRRS